MQQTISVGSLELRFLLSGAETGNGIDMFEMTVPPSGQMPTPHYHRDWDETAYGLTGTVTFTIDGKPHDLAPGAHVFIPRGVVHGFHNTSGQTATCLCILTPGVLGPGYFRELGALIAAGPPDEAKVEEIMRRHGLIPA